MKINTYRTILEQMWQKDKKCFAPDAEFPPLCLRCGKPLNRRLVVNALSRYADVHICEDCGMDEALRDACGQVLPMWEWCVFLCGRVADFHCDGPALTTVCNFNHVYVAQRSCSLLITWSIRSVSWSIPGPTITAINGGQPGTIAMENGLHRSWPQRLTNSQRPCSSCRSSRHWTQ